MFYNLNEDFEACPEYQHTEAKTRPRPADQRRKTSSMHSLKVGDRVVFAKSKQSVSPGPRARQVSAGMKGDAYSYVVDKYWTVQAVNPDGTVTLVTRRGKHHTLSIDTPGLRPASLWDRLFFGSRFPKLADLPPTSEPPHPSA